MSPRYAIGQRHQELTRAIVKGENKSSRFKPRPTEDLTYVESYGLATFPEAASFDHLAGTRGGASQQVETGYSKATAAYQSMVNTLKNAQVPQTSNLWANLDAGYKQAGLDYASGKKPGWKKIDPQDVVCSDSLLLTAALQKLQAADDTLYIRGH